MMRMSDVADTVCDVKRDDRKDTMRRLTTPNPHANGDGKVL